MTDASANVSLQQHRSLPSPAHVSLPTSQMQPAYAYHLAPQGPLPAPPLAAAAAHIHPSVVSLPPLSAMDAIAPMQHHQQQQQHEQHQQQHQQEQQYQQHHQGQHLPSPSPTHSQAPTTHMAVTHMAGTMYPQMSMSIPYSTQLLNTPGGTHVVRYSIPNPHMMISGGRHKKEIKRRTKTGCLTCRKRRIKCDELHPVCRNCQKSKRNCAGYDPVFKTQNGNSSPNQQQARTPTTKSESPSYSTSSAPRVDSLYSSTAPSHQTLYSLSMAHTSGAHISSPVQAVMQDTPSSMYTQQHPISVSHHGRSRGTAY